MVACSSAEGPSKLLGPPSYGPSAPSGSGAHSGAGAGSSPSAPTSPSEPPPPPPPSTSPTPYPDGGAPPSPPSSNDASAPPAAPAGSCGNPKCGQSSDGCGCVAQTDQGDDVFLGCNDQGCVCGHGQNVDQSFDMAGACDSDAAMLTAWQMCTCP